MPPAALLASLSSHPSSPDQPAASCPRPSSCQSSEKSLPTFFPAGVLLTLHGSIEYSQDGQGKLPLHPAISRGRQDVMVSEVRGPGTRLPGLRSGSSDLGEVTEPFLPLILHL